ncbi:MAG: DUF1501 domain-containing protein [Gemmataceae bacterium]
MHCRRFLPTPPTRREMLMRAANGFGAVALSALMAEEVFANAASDQRVRATDNSLASKSPHYQARAKNVIFLYMDGGPSQVDTFDPKPQLDREHGQPPRMRVEPTQFNNIGRIMKSPWRFRRYGESGLPISDLFQNVATCADDLCVIRSMTSKFSEHTNANYFLHSGHGQQGRPSMGAWVTYGLGTENQNLPGFVVVDSGMTPPGGLDCFGSGFLPATFQGSCFRRGNPPVPDIRPPGRAGETQQTRMALMRDLDRLGQERTGRHGAVESAIANYELAFRMQTAVPELMDISRETRATRAMYGLDDRHTTRYGHQCLIARRLVERGVRFVEVLCHGVGHDRWDQHGNLLRGHNDNARAVDKPIAGLLKDLKSRGLLDETLVVWTGEFGRTPMAQGSNGRDHNPFGFSLWMAGGGVKGGMTYGATDEYGYHAIDRRCDIHDLHATMLHLLGLDHTRLTFRFGGRDMRLTDVHGHVLNDIIR